MGVCLRSPIYIYLYHNMTKNTTGVISRFLCTSIQLCRVRTWMWKSWTAGWGWQAIGLPPKSCLLPLLACFLPSLLSCPPPWHTCPRSATTRWWWTPARRSASLRRLSRATLSLLNIRYVLPDLSSINMFSSLSGVRWWGWDDVRAGHQLQVALPSRSSACCRVQEVRRDA